jgi:hypothetical protein
MKPLEPSDPLQPMLRTMQIIAVALLNGSGLFFATALYLVYAQVMDVHKERQGMPPLVSIISVAALLIQATLALWLPGRVVRTNLDKLAGHTPDAYVMPPSEAGPGGPVTDVRFLLMVRQTAMILSMALFEGASFFGSVAYLVEGHPLALVSSVGGIVGVAALFPTRDRVSVWLDRQKAALAYLRRQREPRPRP